MTWLTSWTGLLDILWLLFLIFTLMYFWRDRNKLSETRNWLKTKGKVIQCEWTQEGHQIWPEIEYSYKVNEVDYIGEYLFLDTSHNNPNSAYARKIAYKAAMSYEKNQELDVYYNPLQPQQSALDITLPKKLNVVIGLLVLLILIHLTVIVFRIF